MSDERKSAPLPGPMSRRGKRVNLFTLRFPRVLKFARVAALLTTILVLVGGFRLHRASGQFGEQLLDVGELLMEYDNADHQDGTRVILLNGEQMRMSSGITSDDPHTVLEHFESVCEAHDGGTIEQFTALPRTYGHRYGRFLDPIYRLEGPRGGVVACLDVGEGELTMADVSARVTRFGETHDVHDLGDIRYVFARPTQEGLTHFVTFWTDGSFRLDRALPGPGRDAGGSDLPNVPRPPGSYRTMSASEAGNSDQALQYMGSSMTEWELEHFYQESLVAEGWTLVPIAEDAHPEGLRIVEAHRAEISEILFVTLDTDDAGQGLATIALSH